jgi:hypothetical protein
MHPHDSNARRQFAAEHADELARDWLRAQVVPSKLRQSEKAGHPASASLLNRLWQRRPAWAAAQRP